MKMLNLTNSFLSIRSSQIPYNKEIGVVVVAVAVVVVVVFFVVVVF